jgi:hypothetical protein
MSVGQKTYTVEEALKSVGQDIEKISAEIKSRAKDKIQELALQTHGIIAEKANATLKSTRKTYLDNLAVNKIMDQGDQIIWSVSLGKEAGWIEDGYKYNSLFERVLFHGKPPKQAKDGSVYKIIPFGHQKKPSESSAQQIRLARFANAAIKKQGLDKVINDASGNPIIGKGIRVPVTDKRQPISRFNKPLLAGLTIYQNYKLDKKGNKMMRKGKPVIKRDVMTFRVMSSRHIGDGSWENKAWQGLHAFAEVEKKLDQIFDQAIKDLIK